MKIYGNIMLKDRFFVGTVEVEDGIITGVEKGKGDYDIRGTVIPTFVNMHTHLGDSYYAEEITRPLREVVGPGGLKFEILKDEKRTYDGMVEAINRMERCGTSHFVDFREGGRRGVEMLRNALKGRKIRGIVLGRGALWEEADGIGLSSISDVPYEDAQGLAEAARERGAIFALHASEDSREDIERVLALNPKFVVHFLEATESDMRRLKSAGVPVVLTPRANVFWGKIPDIPRFLNFGITLALGTDNGMVSSPCMFREMEFAYRISRLKGHVPAMEILKMATHNPRRILGIEDNELGMKASLLVFRKIMTPYEVVTRASCEDLAVTMF